MNSATTNECTSDGANGARFTGRRQLGLLAVAAVATGLYLGAPDASGAEANVEGATGDVIGRVVAIRGRVHAQAPGEDRRLLQCGDPIIQGDNIRTADNARLGVLSGEFYAGLDEETTLEFSTTGAGAPDLDLDRGHLRLLDAGQSAPGRIETPGLLAAIAGTDTEAFATPEKAWVVSMICPYDDELSISRLIDPLQLIGPSPGQCAVDKPKERLFLADATHPKLLVLTDGPCAAERLAGIAAPRFAIPPDVSLGPDDAVPPIEADFSSARMACDIGVSCTGSFPGTGIGSDPAPMPIP